MLKTQRPTYRANDYSFACVERNFKLGADPRRPQVEATLGPTTRLSSSRAGCICAVLLYHFVINAH